LKLLQKFIVTVHMLRDSCNAYVRKFFIFLSYPHGHPVQWSRTVSQT